jgi:hypothetical protein
VKARMLAPAARLRPFASKSSTLRRSQGQNYRYEA